jgi:hypothetical protein
MIDQINGRLIVVENFCVKVIVSEDSIGAMGIAIQERRRAIKGIIAHGESDSRRVALEAELTALDAAESALKRSEITLI